MKQRLASSDAGRKNQRRARSNKINNQQISETNQQ
jgi:hypothetical protein